MSVYWYNLKCFIEVAHMLRAAHNRVRSCCIMRSFVKTVCTFSPVHFSARKWSFFAGDNGYIDKMVKVGVTAFASVRAMRISAGASVARDISRFSSITIIVIILRGIRLHAQNLKGVQSVFQIEMYKRWNFGNQFPSRRVRRYWRQKSCTNVLRELHRGGQTRLKIWLGKISNAKYGKTLSRRYSCHWSN